MIRIVILLMLVLSSSANGGNPEFWNTYPGKSPEEIFDIHRWFPTVMQPGWEDKTNQGHSCCGEAEAFEAKIIGEDVVSGDIHVSILDGKGIIPDGTKLYAPRETLQWHYGNPIGKTIIFIGGGGKVYCLVPLAQY